MQRSSSLLFVSVMSIFSAIAQFQLNATSLPTPYSIQMSEKDRWDYVRSIMPSNDLLHPRKTAGSTGAIVGATTLGLAALIACSLVPFVVTDCIIDDLKRTNPGISQSDIADMMQTGKMNSDSRFMFEISEYGTNHPAKYTSIATAIIAAATGVGAILGGTIGWLGSQPARSSKAINRHFTVKNTAIALANTDTNLLPNGVVQLVELYRKNHDAYQLITQIERLIKQQ